jgi:hypothetical protein
MAVRLQLTDDGIGRSRGGRTTKVHLVVDALGLPSPSRSPPASATTADRRCL